MKYAINVSDMVEYPIISFLLSPNIIHNRFIVEAEKNKIDGDAIVLEGDEQQAKAIIDAIRLNCKKHEVRCYKASHSGWIRL